MNPGNLLPSRSWVCGSCLCKTLARSWRPKGQSATRSSSTTTRKPKIPDAPARTRFAPSPTGNLHLGSIRTALFNYLIAKRTGGQFLLRVEDTDQKRTVPGAEQRLFDDLRWAGLHWDEGPEVGGAYGPYRQSERIHTYHEHIKPLLENGKAYRCFCSAERLHNLNQLRHEKGLPLGYDRKCADIPADQAEEKAHAGHSHVIRFRVPEEYPKFVDLIYGKTGHGSDKTKKLQFDEPVYDDPILVKSDGFPTYHFANVVDDQLMKITLVIRGSEWMASTPLHVALYEAFGWTPPAFGHVPLLVDHNRQKLSKRNLDMDIASYRNAGYFPEALTNFGALLGWSHQQKSDVFNLKELEAIFDLKFTKGNTIVSFDKLRYLQEQHARRRIQARGEEYEQMIRDVATATLNQHGAASVTALVGKRTLRDVISSMLQAESIPFQSPTDFANRCSIFLSSSIKPKPSLDISDISLLPSLRVAAATLCLVPSEHWNKETHRANLALLDLSSDNDSKKVKKDLYHYLRWALLDNAAGPSIPETMEILGPEICQARIQEAVLSSKEMENSATKPNVNVTPFKSSKFKAAAEAH